MRVSARRRRHRGLPARRVGAADRGRGVYRRVPRAAGLRLRGEGGQRDVEYRNIRVKDYAREGKWRALFDGKSFDGWKEWGSESGRCATAPSSAAAARRRSRATWPRWRPSRIPRARRLQDLGDGNFASSTTRPSRERRRLPVIAAAPGRGRPGITLAVGLGLRELQARLAGGAGLKSPQAMALRQEQWNEIEIRTAGQPRDHVGQRMRILDLTDQGQQLFEGKFRLQLHSGGVERHPLEGPVLAE